MRRNALLLIFILLLNISTFGENINGILKGSLSLTDENSISIALEEIVAIHFDKEGSFLEGIELLIELPRELQKYRNSFALYMYKNNTPAPDESVRFYKGTRSFMRLLPVQNIIYIKIPAVEDNSIVQSADTIIIPGLTPSENYPLLATILPIMKGIPGEVYNYDFQFSCKPIYSPKGTLSINIKETKVDQNNTYNILIDNKKVKWPSEEFILSEGLHELQITSSSGMSKNASIVISSGEKKTIEMVFEYSEPEILIEAPESTLIFLDGEELVRKNPQESITVETGEHNIIFDIGGYQFSREFSIEPGSSLTITLVLDVLIHKN